MKEAFYEESAFSAKSHSESKLYTLFKVIAFIFFAAGLVFFALSLTAIKSIIENNTGTDRVLGIVELLIMLVLLIGVGLVFWFLRNRFNVSYDYTFVEDELRITKVFNGKRRKHIITMKADHIMQIGWVESDAFKRQLAGMHGNKPKVMTSNRDPMEGKELYYVLYSSSIEKSLYIIEARQMMLEYLVRAAGRNKLERK